MRKENSFDGTASIRWPSRGEEMGASRFFLVIFLLLTNNTNGASVLFHGCLYASPHNDEGELDCTDDPLKVGSLPDVRVVIELLQLSQVPINFQGCKVTTFRTEPGGLTKQDSHFVIYYPIIKTLTPQGYIAPLAHELSHVLQLHSAGSLSELKQKYSMVRIELGADFISGILYQEVLAHINAMEFDNNLNIVGSYDVSANDWHGTPEDRTAAFLIGKNMPRDEYRGSIVNAHRRFQLNYVRLMPGVQ